MGQMLHRSLDICPDLSHVTVNVSVCLDPLGEPK